MASRHERFTRFGLAVLALALLPAGALAQDGTLGDEEMLDIDRQIEGQVPSEDDENNELWEEYQRYRSSDLEDIDVSEYRVSAERVEVGGSIVIRSDEMIEGDVVAVGGEVTVRGVVHGDVVAVGGSIHLDEAADISGDAVAIGGRVSGDGGVSGEKVSIDFPFPFMFKGDRTIVHGKSFGPPHAMTLGFDIGVLVVGLLLAFLVNLVGERRLDVMSRRVDGEPGMSFLIGLLASIGLPFALVLTFLLLLVTIIGLLVFPFILVALVIVSYAGFVAVTIAVGRRAAHARDGDELPVQRSSYQYVFLGFLVMHSFLIVGTLFEAIGGFFAPIGSLFGILGIFVLTFASMLGFGALFTSRLGTRPIGPGPGGMDGGHPGAVHAGWQPAPPPPPPPPPAPGFVADPSAQAVSEMPDAPPDLDEPAKKDETGPDGG